MTADPHTRLLLPVPELHGSVPGAHIVLLEPFLHADDVAPGVLTELEEFFAELPPFAYVLGGPVAFPSGGRYLPPQPVGVFRRITHALRRAFPEVVGATTSLEVMVPHLTLPDGVVVPTPLEVHAREAVLVHGATPLATFEFGSSAA